MTNIPFRSFANALPVTRFLGPSRLVSGRRGYYTRRPGRCAPPTASGRAGSSVLVGTGQVRTCAGVVARGATSATVEPTLRRSDDDRAHRRPRRAGRGAGPPLPRHLRTAGT